jgi:hypothetical protein
LLLLVFFRPWSDVLLGDDGAASGREEVVFFLLFFFLEEVVFFLLFFFLLLLFVLLDAVLECPLERMEGFDGELGGDDEQLDGVTATVGAWLLLS